MIKKIPVTLLKPGMFVSDFNAGWLNHPFMLNCMKISSEEELGKVRAAGIKELYIDTERGLDVGDGVPTAAEAAQQTHRAIEALATTTRPAVEPRVSLAEEMQRARGAFTEATRIIRSLMEDIRLGKQIEIATTRPTVEKIAAFGNAQQQCHDDHAPVEEPGRLHISAFGQCLRHASQFC